MTIRLLKIYGKEFCLDRGKTLMFGKDYNFEFEDQEIHALDIESLDGKHALIQVSSDGTCTIVDLCSKNGTYVNEKRIPALLQVPFKEGCTIKLGTNVATCIIDKSLKDPHDSSGFESNELSFTVPESQNNCVVSSDKNEAIANTGDEISDDEFCIPETQEISDSPSRLLRRNIDSKTCLNMSSEVRISTQDFNSEYSDTSLDGSILASMVIPHIIHDPVLLPCPENDTNTVTENDTLPDNSLIDARPKVNNENKKLEDAGELNNRDGACTPDLFDLLDFANESKELTTSKAEGEAAVNNVTEKIENHGLLSTAPFESNEDSKSSYDMDLMPTQIITSSDERNEKGASSIASNKKINEKNALENRTPISEKGEGLASGNPITMMNSYQEFNDSGLLPATQLLPISKRPAEFLNSTLLANGTETEKLSPLKMNKKLKSNVSLKDNKYYSKQSDIDEYLANPELQMSSAGKAFMKKMFDFDPKQLEKWNKRRLATYKPFNFFSYTPDVSLNYDDPDYFEDMREFISTTAINDNKENKDESPDSAEEKEKSLEKEKLELQVSTLKENKKDMSYKNEVLNKPTSPRESLSNISPVQLNSSRNTSLTNRRAQFLNSTLIASSIESNHLPKDDKNFSANPKELEKKFNESLTKATDSKQLEDGESRSNKTKNQVESDISDTDYPDYKENKAVNDESLERGCTKWQPLVRMKRHHNNSSIENYEGDLMPQGSQKDLWHKNELINNQSNSRKSLSSISPVQFKSSFRNTSLTNEAELSIHKSSKHVSFSFENPEVSLTPGNLQISKNLKRINSSKDINLSSPNASKTSKTPEKKSPNVKGHKGKGTNYQSIVVGDSAEVTAGKEEIEISKPKRRKIRSESNSSSLVKGDQESSAANEVEKAQPKKLKRKSKENIDLPQEENLQRKKRAKKSEENKTNLKKTRKSHVTDEQEENDDDISKPKTLRKKTDENFPNQGKATKSQNKDEEIGSKNPENKLETSAIGKKGRPRKTPIEDKNENLSNQDKETKSHNKDDEIGSKNPENKLETSAIGKKGRPRKTPIEDKNEKNQGDQNISTGEHNKPNEPKKSKSTKNDKSKKEEKSRSSEAATTSNVDNSLEVDKKTTKSSKAEKAIEETDEPPRQLRTTRNALRNRQPALDSKEVSVNNENSKESEPQPPPTTSTKKTDKKLKKATTVDSSTPNEVDVATIEPNTATKNPRMSSAKTKHQKPPQSVANMEKHVDGPKASNSSNDSEKEKNNPNKSNIDKESLKPALNKSVKVLTSSVADNDRIENLLKNAGDIWIKVTDPLDADILVMDLPNRTFKFLVAVTRGIPIVKSSWLEELNSNRKLPDGAKHFLRDKKFQTRYNFNLLTSLEKARSTKIFEGYTFMMTSNLLPTPHDLNVIIQCAGGKVVTKISPNEEGNIFLITSKEDKRFWHKYRRMSSKVVIISTEGIMSAILRQDPAALSANIIE